MDRKRGNSPAFGVWCSPGCVYRGRCTASSVATDSYVSLDAVLAFPSLPLPVSEVPACTAQQMTAESGCDHGWIDVEPAVAPQASWQALFRPSASRQPCRLAFCPHRNWLGLVKKPPKKAERDSASSQHWHWVLTGTQQLVCPTLISPPRLRGQAGRELLSDYPV